MAQDKPTYKLKICPDGESNPIEIKCVDEHKYQSTVVVRMPKFSRDHKYEDFMPGIASLIGEDHIVSAGRLPYPNEFQVVLSTKASREKLLRLGKTKINGRSCWFKPLSDSEVRGYVHWLPNEVPNDAIREILEKYGEVMHLEIDRKKTWRQKGMITEGRYFVLFLHKEVTPKKIPHFLYLNKVRCLITIKGRDPVCLHCRALGHRKINCPKKRQKIAFYSSKKGEGKPRSKPRGERYKPSKSTKMDDKVGVQKEMLKVNISTFKRQFVFSKPANNQANLSERLQQISLNEMAITGTDKTGANIGESVVKPKKKKQKKKKKKKTVETKSSN